ncbi:thioredoxin domain-containing protein [Mucilaginibacter daejeonensis]|uniref:vitamin K epoxide reductase family protein n=1 Tax=Mucilaginibacter daejeonensis TaxID=398049 RepID=UPI001D171C7B|nr:vitamin K epoxide reductase family protein [Mucilaginibacter daejeonensis]UEG51468.1 thioredoxin domain-containing protein [Mucilaginibacter daejeonensis]
MAHTFTTDLKSIAQNYLELINTKVTRSTIGQAIEENPFFPSLYSLSHTFSKFNIPNTAFQIPTTEFDDYEIHLPFVAFVKFIDYGEDFILITDVSDDTITYLDSNKKKATTEKDKFLNRYKGPLKSGEFFFRDILWYAEPNVLSGDPEYNTAKDKERGSTYQKYLLGLSGVVIFLSFIFLNLSNGHVISFLTLLILKTIGVAAAGLLLLYEINKNHAFVRNICSVNRKTDCDAVLSSQASKIFGISWGEIGFFYFAASTLGLLFPTVSWQTKLIWLSIANGCASPYIIFSIYYQWRVLKQWCVLCLTVQCVLAAELIWCIFHVWSTPLSIFPQDQSALIPAVACILLPIAGWFTLKPYLIKANDYHFYKNAYKRLQYNPDIFDSMLKQQIEAPDGWQSLGIDIGDPTAENTIIKICNPYCNPCDQAHPVLEEIIAHNDNVKLKVIFITRNSEFDKGLPVVKHLLSIASESSKEFVQGALDDWYLNVNKDYNKFKVKYSQYNNFEEQGYKVDAMRKWCDDANVTHTPTIYFNGYLLPENYSIHELKNIL